jgi:predicted porin
MKKLLLGATALTMVGFVGAASAQTVSTPRFNTSLGGFMTMGLGYVDSEATGINGGNEFVVVNNAEVIFNFSLVADNGITFGAKVELEANNQGNASGDTVDEYVGFFSGSFGRVEIGAEDGAHDILVGAPVGGNFTAAADGAGFLFDYSSAGVAAPNTQGNDTNDGLKVTYYTPTFAGFRAGVSFAPNNNEREVASPTTTTEGRGIELGVQYNNTFGGFSLFLAGGVTIFDEDLTIDANERDIAYTLNAQVGYAGFKVGAIYGITEFSNDDPTNNFGDTNEAFGLGAEYRTGPWFFGVQYGQNLDQRVTKIDDAMGISAEINYALAPGVTVGLVGEYASDTFANNAARNDNRPGSPDSEEGYAAGVFLGLNF